MALRAAKKVLGTTILASSLFLIQPLLAQPESTLAYVTPKRTDAVARFNQLMPKSAQELDARLTSEEAGKIKEFMILFLDKHKLGNRAQFDENFSHVAGRKFEEIDYTPDVIRKNKGKPPDNLESKVKAMSIAMRKALKGIMGEPPDFTTVGKIENYFKWEEKQSYFKKIYKPGEGTY